MTVKVVELNNNTGMKKVSTYRELLEAHLGRLNEEQGNIPVSNMIIIAHTNEGELLYSVFPAAGYVKVLGMLEATKMSHMS